MRTITKILLFLFISQIFCLCCLYSQNSKIERTNDQAQPSLPWIDGTPLLKTQEKITAEFYQKNPDFLKTNKLNKTSGWNFKVGDKKIWYAVDFAVNSEYPTATTCRAVGQNCYIFVQDSMWDNVIHQSIIDSFVAVFDSRTYSNMNKGIYQMDTEVFGNPPDIDNDSKIIIVLLDIRDNGESGGNTVQGYFSNANELPKSAYALSNEAEMLFLNINYPNAINPNAMYYHFSTIAHEFQHMISWNYNKTNLQWTFIKEGCSLAAEVINGFPLYDEQYFSREPNHYLFDWRSSSDVTTDYSRSSKFHTYLYNQFGAPLFKDIVQSGIVGMDSYNHALTAVGSTLRMDDVIANWFVANCIDDRKFDAAYGYTSNITTTLRSTIKHLPEGTVAKTIEPYAVEYIILGAKDNISAEFTTSGPNIKIRALFSGNSGRKIVNVNTNSVFSDPEFGKKYENCIFIVSNIGSSAQGSFECKLSGNPTVTELKWYSDKANARNVGNAKDISGVCYNSLPGGKLDSVKIAVDRKGLISIKIFRIPAKYGQKPTSGSPVAITNEYTMQSTATHTYPYLYPFPYWFTIDLRKDNISTDEPFLIGISVPEDTANYPMVMMSLPNGYDDISTYKYWNNGNYWSYLAYPTTKMIMVPMLSAFVSFKNNGASKVNEVSPITYSLSQNYPNPFNPETSISFSIPKRGLTAIKIYDVMGREVKTLMNEVMEAGDHIVKFSAANLSSGLYFYKIQCDDFVDTKKMVLLR